MATYKDRITSIDREIEQLENRRKEYIQKEKAAERKARTHRICERGGLLESLLPDTIELTKENFRLFLEKTAANDFGRRALAALKAGQDRQTTAAGADGDPRNNENRAVTPPKQTTPDNTAAADKPTAAHSNGANAAGDTRSTARATG